MIKKLLLSAGFGLAIFGGHKMMIARGIRNNNPGNIRWDRQTAWHGMTGTDDDGFIVFSEPLYGVRAMARILASYSRRGVVSVLDIVSTWAPPSENDTNAYAAHVAQVLGLHLGDTVPKERWPELIAVIIKHENGTQPYSFEHIKMGVALA